MSTRSLQYTFNYAVLFHLDKWKPWNKQIRANYFYTWIILYNKNSFKKEWLGINHEIKQENQYIIRVGWLVQVYARHVVIFYLIEKCRIENTIMYYPSWGEI